MRRSLLRTLFLALVPFAFPAMAAENAFPPTPPGVTELKTLPAGVLLRAAARSGGYFDQSNRLFRPLFNYISSHGIAMTTPVEARIDPAEMYFWVAPSEVAKVSGASGGVDVIRIPERRVASLGARGGYSRENYEEVRDRLLEWVSAQPGVRAAGEPYAVYWHGPFTPWFAKRFEVHLPVSETAP